MATDFQLAGRMVTLGASAARALSLLKMVGDDDCGLLATDARRRVAGAR
jgi:hypothetical protein